jgi:hypothetical protein
LIHELFNPWEGVRVSNGAVIELMIINDWSLGAILFGDKEDRGSGGAVHGAGFDHFSCQHFIKPLVHCDYLFLAKMI